ncbi:hypothetical protein DNJ73_00150 [Prochlorococcus marinus XMU1408]|uniref:Uncharacterized protein n=1 Tax=Prochlorococcus marinus XMU1408 TaxID=2213228 RepID=A0A318R1J8_PROMR|nr:hypothetical protein [Prochlorococcus marinus str. XMU1408]PYE03636.1 hypothetical protein DNJ73_00150 [Prochlorococcus marinus XMU1408]
MYYVDYLVMSASYLKPSLNSINGPSRLRNDKKLYVKKRNHDLIKPLIASICFLLCLVFVPEKPTNLSSICEKYNSYAACQVW